MSNFFSDRLEELEEIMKEEDFVNFPDDIQIAFARFYQVLEEADDLCEKLANYLGVK